MLITRRFRWRRSAEHPCSQFQRCTHEIRLDFTHSITNEACAPIFTGWGHTVALGALPSGVFTATTYINNDACASRAFVVFETVHEIYLPLVTK